MAIMKATKYQDILDLHRKRKSDNIAIGHATRSQIGDDGTVTIIYHKSPIVRLHPDGTAEFTMAGWPTYTTRDRINSFIWPNYVHQDRKIQRYSDRTVSREIDPSVVEGRSWQRVELKRNG